MSDEIKNEFEETNAPSENTNEIAEEKTVSEQPKSFETPAAQPPRPQYPPMTNNQPHYTNPPMQGYYYAPPYQNMQPPAYNTNYYSSVPTGGMPSGSVYSYPQKPQTPPVRNNPEPKEATPAQKKKKSNVGLIITCAVISLACGFAAAFGGLFLFKSAEKTLVPDSNEGTVIFESIDREIPQSVTEAGTVATVAQIALPSVVEIRTEAVVNNSFYGQYVTEGAGSGVIISKDGYIVTNNHVISGASNINVRLNNGEEYKAELIGTDAQTDIAVIKIEAENLTPAVFGDSSKLVIGELTVAIGNPLGELGGTVTDGIISALDREITVEGENMILLQTNAAVSPGNSGGGLFNSRGELIGIVNAKSSGSSVEGLGFAIPITTAKPIITDLIEKGHVTGRPSIGITIIEITSDYQRYMYGVSDYGVYIQNALNEEFKSGDRIIAIDGNSVSTSSDIKSIINSHNVGDTITVTVSRKNKIVDVNVTLIDSADNTLTTD